MLSIAVLALLLLFPITFSAALHCSTYTDCSSCLQATTTTGVSLCVWCSNLGSCHFISTSQCTGIERFKDILECPRAIPDDYMYSDEFARTAMMPLAAAAYSEYPQRCLSSTLYGTHLIRLIERPCAPSSTVCCAVYTAVSDLNNANIIVFRGSDQPFHETDNALRAADSVKPAPLGGYISEYFHNAFALLWDGGAFDDVTNITKKNPAYELWITGHSIGASLATIAAHKIISQNIVPGAQIRLLTFGEPRTGDRRFAQLNDENLPYSYRVIHGQDPMPRLPPATIRGYFHRRYEVWYDNQMLSAQYRLCSSPEDPSCSMSKVAINMFDHFNYFGKDFRLYARLGCPNIV